jgi:hypothetical protein
MHTSHESVCTPVSNVPEKGKLLNSNKRQNELNH